MTWYQLLERFLEDAVRRGVASFTRREVAEYWVREGLVEGGSRPDWVLARASDALVGYDRRAGRLSTPPPYVVRCEGYGPASCWSVLEPGEALASLRDDAHDAATRLARDLACHAKPAAMNDPAVVEVVEKHARAVAAQLEAMMLHLELVA